MARLHTAGFESGIPGGTSIGGETNGGVENRMVGTPTYQSSVARNGGFAMACAAGGSHYEQVVGLTHTADVPTYARFYLRTNDATPSATLQLFVWRLGGAQAGDIVLLTNGKLRLRDANQATIGDSSTTLSADTWYRIETRVTIPASGNGSLELRIDGISEVVGASVDVNNALTTTTHRIGHMTGGETSSTLYFDDLAINDGNGADNNSWPGPGNVTLLKPTGDNAKGTGWEGPQTSGSDTTNLYDNVDNVPPAGVAHSDVDANAGKYLFNAANLGAASEYRASCQSMDDAGIPAGAVVRLSQAYMRASTDSTTATNNMELQGIAPADSAVTCDLEQGSTAGTEPTGWKSFRTAYTPNPSLAPTDVPVVEATKILTGSTRAHMVDQIGLLIEWHVPLERSASLSAATNVATSGEVEAGATAHERSAAIAATGAIASAATFYSVVERTAAIAATGAVATGHERDQLRTAAISAASGVETSGLSVLERTATLGVAASLNATSQRDLVRSAALAATADTAAAGDVEVVHARSAALTATTAITAAGEHELPRAAALAATSAVTAAGEAETGAGTHERSAAVTATAAIAAASQRELLRSADLAAATAIAAASQRDHQRQATLASVAALTSSSERELARSVTLAATGAIASDSRLGSPVQDVAITLSTAGSAMRLIAATAAATELSGGGAMILAAAGRAKIELENETDLEVSYG